MVVVVVLVVVGTGGGGGGVDPMLQPGSQAEECTEAPLLYVRSASISFINLGQVYAVLSVDWRAGI